jgi:hypothetical protein
MNKLKLFVVSAALLIVTIGVFAGKSRFAESLNLYVDNGVSKIQITNGSQSFTQLTTTSGGLGIQAQIRNRDGANLLLYHQTAPSTYVPVYSTSAW